MAKLPYSFYRRPDAVEISKDLLGKYLFTCCRGRLTGGLIVETEAYAAPDDRASHAWNNRRTKRTEIMYHDGGVAYVYLCYGVHALFNVITNVRDIPHAILVRALEPTHGLESILSRRGRRRLDRRVAGGPGALTAALGITLKHNGEDLRGQRVWIEDRGIRVRDADILAGPRVGVPYAGRHARRPWRFRIRNSPWTSTAK